MVSIDNAFTLHGFVCLFVLTDFDAFLSRYFSQDVVLDQVPWMFILLGGCYAFMQLIGSLLLCNPPYSEVRFRLHVCVLLFLPLVIT